MLRPPTQVFSISWLLGLSCFGTRQMKAYPSSKRTVIFSVSAASMEERTYKV